jgi:membrane protein required for colicin V production
MATDWLGRLASVDGLMLVVLLLSSALGIWRGLVFEVLSLAGWLLAWLAAAFGGDALGAWMAVGEPDSLARTAAGFVVAFIGTLLLCALLARLAKALIAASPLSLMDRMLGAGFGVARGLLLLLVLVTVAEWTPIVRATWWQGSTSVAWLSVLRHHLQPWLPADLRLERGA